MTTLRKQKVTMTVIIQLFKDLVRVAQLVCKTGLPAWWPSRIIECLKDNRAVRATLGRSTTEVKYQMQLKYIRGELRLIETQEVKMAWPTQDLRVSIIWSIVRSKVRWVMYPSVQRRKVPAATIRPKAYNRFPSRWTTLAVCQDLFKTTRKDSILKATINHLC